MRRISQTDTEDILYYGFPLNDCLRMCIKDVGVTKIGENSIQLAPQEYIFDSAIQRINWRPEIDETAFR